MPETLSKAKFKTLRSLTRRKAREESGLFIAEGVRIIEEVTRHGLKAEFLVTLADDETNRGAEAEARRSAAIAGLGCEHFELAKADFAEVADTGNSQGLLAIVQMPKLEVDSPTAPLLVLDSIRDPGNLGACLRSAAAFGLRHVSLVKGCADPWEGKAVRASMGGLFALQGLWREDQAAALARAHTRSVVLALDARPDLTSFFDAVAGATGPISVVIGGETEGLSEVWTGDKVRRVQIPQASDIDSLNAAMASTLAANALFRKGSGGDASVRKMD